MSVKEKLGAIQTELKAPKDLYNSYGKYKYRNAEGIVEAVKPLLSKYKALLTIEDDVEQRGERFYVVATCRFYDLEDDSDSVIIRGMAREADARPGMDPAQITGAASSYARKYALNGLLMLDDTKDPDTEELKTEVDAKASVEAERMKKDLLALAFKAGVETAKICEMAGVKDLRDIDAKTYSRIVAGLNEKIAQQK